MVRTRLDPDERRDRILDAAVACFAAEGTRASTRRIARAAGVSEALVYHYFPTKGALWIGVVTRSGTFAEAVARELASDQPLDQGLARVGEAFVAMRVEERQLVAVLLGAALRDDPVGEQIRQGHARAIQRLAAALAGRGVVDPEVAATGLLGGLVLFFLTHHRDPAWAPLARAFADRWRLP